MQNEEFDDITLQRYLDDDMSEQERKTFEKNIEENETLKNEVATYKTLAAGIAYQGKKAAWEKVQALEKQAEQRPTPVKPMGKNRLWYAIAASVALLITAYFIFFHTGSEPEELFAEYFEPYPALAYAPNRNDTVAENLKEQAFGAYSNENYDEAINLFQQILEKEDEPVVWFYLGNAYLAGNQPENAIQAFNKTLENNTDVTNQSQWFLALSYLANNNPDRAVDVLEQLSNTNSTYKNKAEQLLQTL